MSEVKVVRHFPKQKEVRIREGYPKQTEYQVVNDIQLIAIGASTGGPAALKIILSNLPKDLPVPVVIVQHIAKEFVKGFMDWLSGTSNIPLHIAQNGDLLIPGNGYIAPDDHQMGIYPGPRIKLSISPEENSVCPSIDYLFRSVSEVMSSKAIGVLLTGMGKDGAKELKAMKEKGAITIAQDEESCIVYGMPQEAIKIGAVDHILQPEKIAEYITELFKIKN